MNLIVMIIVFSIIYIILSFLNIKASVELTFKPIYKPLLAEMYAFSLSNSEIGDKLVDYYIGKVNEGEIKNILDKIIATKYFVCIENKCLGDARIKGEEAVIPIITKNNKKLKLKVIIA